jgi:protein-S-isoprenylcysteine O-methyltransferase Ste14
MNFRATNFEFRQRFWIIGGIFFVGFFCYAIDPVNISMAAASLALGLKLGQDSASMGRAAHAILGLGAAFVTVAALLRSWAESYLHSSVVHDAGLRSERLVADGPFRHVRNPLYLGNILLAVGLGFMASRLGFVVIAGGMTVFVVRLILCEEANLLQSQGESYRKYFEKVPRLVPSIRARVPSAGGRPNWVDGLTGELFVWGAAAGAAAFAVSARILHFWIAFGLGLGIYFLQDFLRRKAAAGPDPRNP